MIMTDRQLLDAAAKAAGYTLSADGMMRWDDDDAVFMVWNPLHFNAHAFVLMVDCRITFRNFGHKVTAVGKTQCDEYVNNDLLGAARRAIVRVAADQGGEGMR